ncbi:M48 family metalloprotease [Hymenobacter sp. 102]|uniref:M48 family metallopeptidase n=1 Tax=Hymenobacter sp. 102 TaxID=3403152 RepID=UPI003CEB7494
MTREEFVAELRRLHPLAEANPTSYRRRVWGWALLGYGFIALLLAGTVGLLGAVLAVGLAAKALGAIWKIGVLLVVFGWRVLRSLWVKFERPEGLPLGSAEAAPLLTLLRAQTRALKAPRVHQVLLTAEFNASAVQVPRLGMLGWTRNYVVVGLPLLQALSPEQAAAVVAHELGHLRGGHGRFGVWIYRVSSTWDQLMSQLEQQGGAAWLQRFTRWYVPRLNAWSHPVRRTDEFEADAAAARLTSAAAMAEALCATVVREQALDTLYWNPLIDRLATEPAPPGNAISGLLPVARTGHLPITEEARALQQALEADPDPFSTHPTLGERLRALGQPGGVPALPTQTAAEAWLGDQLPRLAASLDANWAAERTGFWQERHAELQEQRQRRQTLAERQAAGEELSADDAWALADLTEDHVGADEALPLFQALFTNSTWELAARFAVGRILLSRDDAAGLPLLDEVMSREPNFMGPCLALQEAYYTRAGNREQVRELAAAQLRHADIFDLAAAERASVEVTDQLHEPTVSETLRAELQTRLSRPELGVQAAWLLQKRVQHFPHKPFFVLLVQPAVARRSPEEVTAWVRQVAGSLDMEAEILVVNDNKQWAWLGEKARQTPGAAVYPVA